MSHLSPLSSLSATEAQPLPHQHRCTPTAPLLPQQHCCFPNAVACPPLRLPLSLPTATVCHCRPASTTPTMPRHATVRNPPMPGESPACSCCHPLGVATPLSTPMPPTPTLAPEPMPMPMSMQKQCNEWQCKIDGSGNHSGQRW